MTETLEHNPTDRLTEKEFARAVGCGRNMLIRLRQEGVIPFCRLGRKVFYLRRHIDEFYEAVEQNKIPQKVREIPKAATKAATKGPIR